MDMKSRTLTVRTWAMVMPDQGAVQWRKRLMLKINWPRHRRDVILTSMEQDLKNQGVGTGCQFFLMYVVSPSLVALFLGTQIRSSQIAEFGLCIWGKDKWSLESFDWFAHAKEGIFCASLAALLLSSSFWVQFMQPNHCVVFCNEGALFGASFAVGTSDQKRGLPVCLQLGQVPHVTSSVQWSRPAYHTPISARLNRFLFFPSGF